MPGYYLDSSALVKRHVLETGHTWIVGFCGPNAVNTIVIAGAALVEAVATFHAWFVKNRHYYNSAKEIKGSRCLRHSLQHNIPLSKSLGQSTPVRRLFVNRYLCVPMMPYNSHRHSPIRMIQVSRSFSSVLTRVCWARPPLTDWRPTPPMTTPDRPHHLLTLKRKWATSPSWMMYSLPSRRNWPFSRVPAKPPAASRSS